MLLIYLNLDYFISQNLILNIKLIYYLNLCHNALKLHELLIILYFFKILSLNYQHNQLL